ncbi:MAG TPA: hypothetical protein VH143_15705 [Kofleriaceae bacterium]|jgi:hypothetical protein|nr:hypothetical protein [Kofleriaceae bacterium]
MRAAVIVVVALVACQRDTVRPRLERSRGFTVELSLGGGYPPFDDAIAIASDGRVTRELHDGNRDAHGSGTIAPSEVAALRTQLESVAFADLEPSYGDSEPDGGRLYLEVDTGAGVRMVTCNAPAALHDVAAAILAIRDRVALVPPVK